MFFLLFLLVLIFQTIHCFPITHGVGAGEATATTVVIWSRTNKPGAYMHVKLIAAEGPSHRFVSSKTTSLSSDYSMRIFASGLKPNTEYTYRVCFTDSLLPFCKNSDKRRGKFVTAAPKDLSSPVKIVWGGDLAGQDVCRDAKRGFPIFRPMRKENPTVIVLSGDMIYADNLCSKTGLYGNTQIIGDFIESSNIKDFRAHWAYNREDRLYTKFLESANVLVAWDDHEIVNVRFLTTFNLDVISDIPEWAPNLWEVVVGPLNAGLFPKVGYSKIDKVNNENIYGK